MNARFSLGIDLGTSNSAIAVSDLDDGQTRIVEVAQIVGQNQVGRLPTMASTLYLPHAQEFPGGLAMPWSEAGDTAIIGQFARDHGALVPDRLITSAKSWLSNPHIDPRQALLPWGSDIGTEKLSPFEVSRRYLAHLKNAFLQAEAEEGRTWDIADGQIVLTVPASFDEVARSLTAEAARDAGLGDVTLLEEPQAAFYAWTAQTGRAWHDLVAPGDIVLVCDVGGGTADFSLIAVNDVDGSLELERISVGEHILLGGDNMDLALAYTLQAKLEDEGKTLDSWQFLSLTHAASRAKIALFQDAGLAEAPIAVPSRGSGLFASTISTSLDRTTLEQVVLDGFLARTALDDLPQREPPWRVAGIRPALRVRSGRQQAHRPVPGTQPAERESQREAVRAGRRPRQRQRADADGGAVQRRRVQGGADPDPGARSAGVLERRPADPRTARRRTGPCGRARRSDLRPLPRHRQGHAHQGRRGPFLLCRAWKVPAWRSPACKPKVKALCVVPQGMQEGSELLIEGREFGLVTGRPAEFRFFSSAVRSGDTPGQVLPDAERELEDTSLLEVEIPALDDFPSGQVVPVRIDAVVTELGTLELWMQHVNSDRRWKVEFQVRTE